MVYVDEVGRDFLLIFFFKKVYLVVWVLLFLGFIDKVIFGNFLVEFFWWWSFCVCYGEDVVVVVVLRLW